MSVGSTTTYTKVNPWRPGEVVGEFAAATPSDVEAAVGAASDAFRAWSRSPLATRGSYLLAAAASLERRADEIATDMLTEMGKPIREARGETLRAAQILRFFAGEAYRAVGEQFEQSATGALVGTRRRPLGVVGLITPWNFPIAIPVWKLAPALVYGNTVVLKLGYEAPRTGLHGRRRARLQPARPRDLVHRVGAGRTRRARRGDGPQLPRPARAGRAQPV